MSAISQVNFAIERGERAAHHARPATLIYAGVNIPCSPGNKTFFQRLKANQAGFQSFQNLFLKILRSDIPTIPDGNGVQKPVDFRRGQPCQVRNDDPDCPVPGEIFNMVIGENNQMTSMVIMLNVESEAA